MTKTHAGLQFGFQVLARFLALVFTTLILLAGASAAVGSLPQNHCWLGWLVGKFSDVLVAWVPLLLATAGLLVTFTAGLWNIGVEGQITLGAIFTTWVLRCCRIQPCLRLIIIMGYPGGILGGALWAALPAR